MVQSRPMSDSPLRVGLVGAGPWAGMFHAPMLAAGPHTSLDAVWARRTEAAEELAGEYAATAVGSFEELLERSDVIAFAVPPDVQAELAPRAAAAGKHLVLEKPLAFTVEGAQAIVDAVDAAGVMTLVILRNRYTATGRAFLAAAQAAAARGGQARYVTGAALEGSPFATPWRVERGALFDLAPHVLDLMDGAMGLVEGLTAVGDPRHWVALETRHAGGAVGQVSLSITTPETAGPMRCEVFTENGPVVFDGAASDGESGIEATLMEVFAEAVASGVPPEADVHRALHLQRLIAAAEDSLAQA